MAANDSPQKLELSLEERRAKREARREKQRRQNVGRAAKMHEVRIAVEREGAPIHEPTDSTLPRINVGCSGWFYWHWRETFYPQELPTNRWFEHYRRHFKTVELNAPFYSWPSPAVVASWLRQAARTKFIYTVKVSELITHTKRFIGTKELVRDFGYIADLLGNRMGCFLFQLPPSFHYTRPRLHRIVDQLDPARRNVVEFRHRSWWNEEVYGAFRESGTIFCSCSGPRLPDELVKTADEIYLRFHGTARWYRHDYSVSELALWAEKIKASGARRVWAYFNNDRDCYAIKNARALRKLLQ
ncbi:MAG TPA: DUF72 domain-containing protein [Chthoniobacterales bacterium]|jgi:uncharacterized protein YecE (DUF72 family)